MKAKVTARGQVKKKDSVDSFLFDTSIEIKATKNLSVCDSWIAEAAFVENVVSPPIRIFL